MRKDIFPSNDDTKSEVKLAQSTMCCDANCKRALNYNCYRQSKCTAQHDIDG